MFVLLRNHYESLSMLLRMNNMNIAKPLLEQCHLDCCWVFLVFFWVFILVLFSFKHDLFPYSFEFFLSP